MFWELKNIGSNPIILEKKIIKTQGLINKILIIFLNY
jgi:hypothetical protein